MEASFSELEAAGLPEIIGRFADKEKGLIVFSGADSAAVSSSAIVLARFVQERAGRTVTVIDYGQDSHVRLESRFARVTAEDRFDQPVQVRWALEDGARVILIDCRPDADTLIEAVEAARGGALVIITMPFSGTPTHSWSNCCSRLKTGRSVQGSMRCCMPSSSPPGQAPEEKRTSLSPTSGVERYRMCLY